MITGLLYKNTMAPAEEVTLENLSYKSILRTMGLPETADIEEQFPWPDKPYALLSLAEFGPEDVIRTVSDVLGFTTEVGGPMLFFKSELDNDDYQSLDLQDILFIRQMVSDEVQ